jgi:hypothetical protein
MNSNPRSRLFRREVADSGQFSVHRRRSDMGIVARLNEIGEGLAGWRERSEVCVCPE